MSDIHVNLREDMTVKLMQHMGSDSGIVAAARVSTTGSESAETFDTAEGEGLINFLMSNRHGTPFEHNAMTFLIEAPIFVFREFHRHRIGWSYNEESARYKELKPTFYIPSTERNLVQVGKAGAYSFVPGTPDQFKEAFNSMVIAYKQSYTKYKHMMAMGIAKELARSVLPVAIYSSMYATCNTRSLMAFLSLRTRSDLAKFPSGPMREIEMVAEGMEKIFAEKFPITYRKFNDNGRIAP